MAINNFNVGVGTTSQLTRYRYVATGGETSISGADADGKTLSYTVGLEQVFLNGVNLVRGQDYTATNGTSIGNLTALVASDSLEVFAYVPFNIANAVTASTVDAKGDLLVGTGADTVGRLAVGSTNGQLLAVDSSTASGLKWANPGLTLIKTESFNAQSSVSIGSDAAPLFTSTYKNYKLVFSGEGSLNTPTNFNIRLRANTTDATAANYYYWELYRSSGTGSTDYGTSGTAFTAIGKAGALRFHLVADLQYPQVADYTTITTANVTIGASESNLSYSGGYHNVASSYNGMTFLVGSGTVTGEVSIYGYNA